MLRRRRDYAGGAGVVDGAAVGAPGIAGGVGAVGAGGIVGIAGAVGIAGGVGAVGIPGDGAAVGVICAAETEPGAPKSIAAPATAASAMTKASWASGTLRMNSLSEIGRLRRKAFEDVAARPCDIAASAVCYNPEHADGSRLVRRY